MASATESPNDRLRLILGDEGLARLDGSTVLVIGLGGVGSNCAEALARGGVGGLVLLDRDVVAPSNINRQAVAFHSTIGLPKTDVMSRIVRDINPEARVTAVHGFLPKEGLSDVLDALPRPDYVVDAIDTSGAEAGGCGVGERAWLSSDKLHGWRQQA